MNCSSRSDEYYDMAHSPISFVEANSRPTSTEVLDMPSQSGVPLALYPSYSSTSSEGSDASLFSSTGSQSESSCSSQCGEGTPLKVDCLSESPTPTNDDTSSLDPDQLALRLHIHAALSGTEGLPKWDGLAGALQVYFANSWQKDEYTLQQCEKSKEFLFWNAVAEGKWRSSRG